MIVCRDPSTSNTAAAAFHMRILLIKGKPDIAADANATLALAAVRSRDALMLDLVMPALVTSHDAL